MEQNSTPSKEIISVMMELKEKALEQSERRKQMQATLTIKAVDQIIVDEATGQKWRIISDEEYKNLCREYEIGDTGDLAWFLSKVHMSLPTAKEKILYPFRKELEIMVDYADAKGKRWKFHKTRVSEWLENNWSNYQ